ncbi:RHS repeat-associated core domain-containing protein [Psychrobacter faecalis]
MLFKTQTPLKDGKPLKQSNNSIIGYRTSLQLAYNADHELTRSIAIQQQGLELTEVTTTYHYDAFGRRISKHSQTKDKTRLLKTNAVRILDKPIQPSKTRQHRVDYLWDGNRQLQETTDTHQFTTIYEQDSFEPVARLVWLKNGLTTAANDEPETDEGWYGNNKPITKTGVQLYHYHNDHLGTPNELTDQQGEVVWFADYEAWGNTAQVVWREQVIDNVKVSKDELQPIRFQGQSFDVETGLHYNRFRYFDPDLGMFTSRDPIGLLGGTNVFQYAPNPTGWIDPFGLSGWTKTNTLGRTVYQNDSLFDPSRKTSWVNDSGERVFGTNVDRMADGRAPTGKDRKPVQLHHLTQTELNANGTRGSLAEISTTSHQKNSKVLHYPSPMRNPNNRRQTIPKYPSFRMDNMGNRTSLAGEFDEFRSNYWKNRADGFNRNPCS